ncbi:MAG: SLC13 family permease [Calditrichia bacterium]
MSVALVLERLESEIVIFGTLILLMVGQVITVEEAFAGFSNTGVLTIALLFVVAGSLQTTGALNYLSPLVFGNQAGRIRRKLGRILLPVAAISAFMNNTPIVALFIPAVRSWTERHNHAASHFLIPLSYAAILGGMCTLIGTSTNLIIHGLLIEHGLPGFSFFEIGKIGLPATLLGLLFIILAGPRLLPERKKTLVRLGEKTREFVIELKVTREYQGIGKTIESAGLRHLKGLFLFQIERDHEMIAPAPPDEEIRLNDRLFFTGIPKTIIELQKTPGLQLIKDSDFDLKEYDSEYIKTYEAVVSASSPLVGMNVRESNFREKYDAVIIAIHRNGQRIKKKIGDIVLHPGDTLLLLAQRKFQKKWYHSNDFYLVSSSEEIYNKPQWQARLSITVMAGMILLAVSGILPLITAAGLAAIFLVLSRSISPGDAKNMMDWKVLMIVASAFGIAKAIENAGVATALADLTIKGASPLGIPGILAGLYIITGIYTSFITNNAAAAFLFPVALSLAGDLGMEIRPFAMTVTIAAAASFATPISYQTNLMVYGPGGYKFRDYLKMGIPLQILVGVVTVIMVYKIYF